MLVEANIGQGVVAAPLSKYARFHTRICRPIGLTEDDRARVCAYAAERIGFDYDLKNIIDLMRYLLPLPVPQRWRRRMIALGSGHPTRIICSALIAQAFETVRYPILPKVTMVESEEAREEILEIRHSSLYAPRDFDISPYFEVVKPTIACGFDYKAMAWADMPAADADEIGALVPAEPDTLEAAPSRPCLARLRARALPVVGMFDAAVKALSQMFTPALRAVLLKAIGLALRADRHHRHRLHRLIARWRRPAPTGPSRPPALRRTPPGRCSPGCCRSWPGSASSPARCS